jgi:hypothetical protein
MHYNILKALCGALCAWQALDNPVEGNITQEIRVIEKVVEVHELYITSILHETVTTTATVTVGIPATPVVHIPAMTMSTEPAATDWARRTIPGPLNYTSSSVYNTKDTIDFASLLHTLTQFVSEGRFSIAYSINISMTLSLFDLAVYGFYLLLGTLVIVPIVSFFLFLSGKMRPVGSDPSCNREKAISVIENWKIAIGDYLTDFWNPIISGWNAFWRESVLLWTFYFICWGAPVDRIRKTPMDSLCADIMLYSSNYPGSFLWRLRFIADWWHSTKTQGKTLHMGLADLGRTFYTGLWDKYGPSLISLGNALWSFMTLVFQRVLVILLPFTVFGFFGVEFGGRENTSIVRYLEIRSGIYQFLGRCAYLVLIKAWPARIADGVTHWFTINVLENEFTERMYISKVANSLQDRVALLKRELSLPEYIRSLERGYVRRLGQHTQDYRRTIYALIKESNYCRTILDLWASHEWNQSKKVNCFQYGRPFNSPKLLFTEHKNEHGVHYTFTKPHHPYPNYYIERPRSNNSRLTVGRVCDRRNVLFARPTEHAIITWGLEDKSEINWPIYQPFFLDDACVKSLTDGRVGEYMEDIAARGEGFKVQNDFLPKASGGSRK